jgi:outer membrane protein assembly factor BamB
MRHFRRTLGLAAALGALLLAIGGAAAQSILTFHNDAARGGLYVMPRLTYERAANLHLDRNFDGKVEGNIYAQPLFWHFRQTSRKLVVVATEANWVYALDARDGKVAWKKSLGTPVPRSALPCGNIGPLGITGTPAIDLIKDAIYVDAMVDAGGGAGAQHLVFGLSVADGSVLPGFPVNVAEVLKARGMSFTPRVQNQRGALLIAENKLFVPYGGHFGDCGQYRGWVVGIDLNDPRSVSAWSTRAFGGGIWAPGGISYDGRSLFVSTGNTMGTAEWADGEAIIRLGPDLKRSGEPRDFFAPSDWKALDDADLDLGGVSGLPLDVADPDGKTALLLALGKDGKAYLLDRTNLGGIGGALDVQRVARNAIRTSPAVLPTQSGSYVAFEGAGTSCPNGVTNGNLTVLKIDAHPAPKISPAWCGAINGRGAPIVTTDDDDSNPIVWMVGAEGDDRLHGFRADNGTPVFTGGGPADVMTGLRHFVTILATDDRLFVAGDGRVYAFKP